MFAVKIVRGALLAPVARSFTNPLTCQAKSPNVSFVRAYRASKSKIIEVQQHAKKTVNPLNVGQMAVAGGAVIGLGSLCFYGLGLSNEVGAIDRMAIWPDYIRKRVRDTYMYFGASVGVTAASAIAVFRSPLGHRYFEFCARHPIMSMVGVFAGLIASSQAMMMVPYSPGIGSKQGLWALNCGIIGLAIAPVATLGGALALRAAWYTAGIMGGLSTVAMCAPSDKFLNWAGPLGLGLGGVLVATIGSAFLPPTSMLGLSLYSISIYGGLILFSGFLLYDTQKIIQKAETHPAPEWSIELYDPINGSHRILMDAVNIFVRIVQILAMGGRRK